MAMMLGEAQGVITLDISDLQRNAGLATASLEQLDGAASTRGISGLEKQLGAAGVTTTQFGAGLLTVGALLGAPMVIGVKNAQDLEHQMRAVEAAMDMDDRGRLGQLRDMIIEIGASGQYSAGEMALVTEELVKSGFAIDQILSGDPAQGFGNMTQAVSDLASATGSGLDTSVRAISSAMQIWSEAVVDTDIALTDASRAADIFTVAANASAADVTDISAGMRNFGPIAASMGIGFDDASAAIAYFTNYGIKATVAGTALSTGLSRLANPTGKAAAAIEELGIQAFDAEGKFVGLPNLMDQLKESTKNLTMEQKLQAMQTIFGLEAMDAMILMAETGSKPLTDITEQMKEHGIASEQAALRTQTLTGALERMWEGIGTFLMVMASGLVKPLTWLANGIDYLVAMLLMIPEPLLMAIGFMVTLAAGAATLGGAFILLYPKIQQARMILMALATTAGPLQGIAKRILGLVGPANKAAIAFRALRLAMLGGLLFAGVPFLWEKNFLGIPQRIRNMVGDVKSAWDEFKGIFSDGSEEIRKDIDVITGQMQRLEGSGADGFDYNVLDPDGNVLGKQLESWTNEDGTVGVKVELENGDIVEGTIDMLTGEYTLDVEVTEADTKIRTFQDKLNDLKAWNDEKGIGFMNPIVDAIGGGVKLWNGFSSGASKAMDLVGALHATFVDLTKVMSFGKALRVMWDMDERLSFLPHTWSELGDVVGDTVSGIGQSMIDLGESVSSVPIIGGPLGRGLTWLGGKVTSVGDGVKTFGRIFDASMSMFDSSSSMGVDSSLTQTEKILTSLSASFRAIGWDWAADGIDSFLGLKDSATAFAKAFRDEVTSRISRLSDTVVRGIRGTVRGFSNFAGTISDVATLTLGFWEMHGKSASMGGGATQVSAFTRAYESLAYALDAVGWTDAANNVRRFGANVDAFLGRANKTLQGFIEYASVGFDAIESGARKAGSAISTFSRRIWAGDFEAAFAPILDFGADLRNLITEGLQNLGEFMWNLVLGEPAIAFGYDIDELIQNGIGKTAEVLIKLVLKWVDGFAEDPAKQAAMSLMAALGIALGNLYFSGNLGVLFRFVRVLGLYGIAAYIFKQIYDYFRDNPAKLDELKIEFGRVWSNLEEGKFGAIFTVIRNVYEIVGRMIGMFQGLNDAINSLPGPLGRVNDVLGRIISVVAGKNILMFLGGGVSKNQNAIQAMLKGLWEIAKFPVRMMLKPQEVLHRMTNFLLNKGPVGKPNRGILGFFKQVTGGVFKDTFRGASLATKGITKFFQGLNTPMRLPKSMEALRTTFSGLEEIIKATGNDKFIKQWGNDFNALSKAIASGNEKQINSVINRINKLQKAVGVIGDDVFDVRQLAYFDQMPNKLKRVKNAFRLMWTAAKGPADEITRMVLRLDEFGELMLKEIPVGNRKLTLINKTARRIEGTFRGLARGFRFVFDIIDRADDVAGRLHKTFPRLTAALRDTSWMRGLRNIEGIFDVFRSQVRGIGGAIADALRAGFGGAREFSFISAIDSQIARLVRLGARAGDAFFGGFFRRAGVAIAAGFERVFMPRSLWKYADAAGAGFAIRIRQALGTSWDEFAKGARGTASLIAKPFRAVFRALFPSKPMGIIALDAKQMKAADALLDILTRIGRVTRPFLPTFAGMRASMNGLLAPVRALAKPFQAIDSRIKGIARFLPGINEQSNVMLKYGAVGAVAAAVGYALWETNLWGFRDAFGGVFSAIGDGFGALSDAYGRDGIAGVLEAIIDGVEEFASDFPGKMADIFASQSWGPLIAWGTTLATLFVGGPFAGILIGVFAKDIERMANSLINSGRRIFRSWEKNGPAGAIKQFARELSLSSKGFGEWVRDLGEGFNSVADQARRIPVVGDAIGGFFDLIGDGLTAVGSKIYDFGENLRQNLLAGQEPIEAIKNAFEETFPAISEFIGNMQAAYGWVQKNIPAIGDIFTSLGGFVMDALRVIGDLLTGDFQGAMENFNSMMENGGNAVTAIFESIIQAIQAINWEDVSNKLMEFGENLMGTGFLGTTLGVALWIIAAAIDGIRFAIEAIQTVWGWLEDGFNWIVENVPGVGPVLDDIAGFFGDAGREVVNLVGAFMGLRVVGALLTGSGILGKIAGAARAMFMPFTLARAGVSLLVRGLTGFLIPALAGLGPVGWAAVAAVTLAVVAYKTNFLGFADYIDDKVSKVKGSWEELQNLFNGDPVDWKRLFGDNEMMNDIIDGLRDIREAWRVLKEGLDNGDVDWTRILDLLGVQEIIDDIQEAWDFVLAFVDFMKDPWGSSGQEAPTPAEVDAGKKQPQLQYVFDEDQLRQTSAAWNNMVAQGIPITEDIYIAPSGAIKIKSAPTIELDNPNQLYGTIKTLYQNAFPDTDLTIGHEGMFLGMSARVIGDFDRLKQESSLTNTQVSGSLASLNANGGQSLMDFDRSLLTSSSMMQAMASTGPVYTGGMRTAVTTDFGTMSADSIGSMAAMSLGADTEFNNILTSARDRMASARTVVGTESLASRDNLATNFLSMRTVGTSEAEQLRSGVYTSFTNMQSQGNSLGNQLRSGVSSNIGTMRSSVVSDTGQMRFGSVDNMTKMRAGGLSQANALRSGVSGALSSMKSGGIGQALGMKSGVLTNMDTMSSEGQSATSGMTTGMIGHMLGAKLKMLVATLEWIGVVKNAGPSMRSAGESIGLQAANGVAAGMRSGLASVISASNAIIATVVRTMAIAAIIRSPSRLLENEIGLYLTKGVGTGMVNNQALMFLTGKAKGVIGHVASSLRNNATMASRDLDISSQIMPTRPSRPTNTPATNSSGGGTTNIYNTTNGYAVTTDDLARLLESSEKANELDKWANDPKSFDVEG